jgi:crossover junction endodeoxyribonuclease RusA
MSTRLTLPYPPSVNNYYRAGSKPGSRYLTDRATVYRRTVSLIVGAQRARQGMTERLRMAVVVNPPDRRARDVDNLLKALLDSLQHAGVYESDAQIDDLRIVRGPVIKGGQVVVDLTAIEAPSTDAWREIL